MNKLVACIEDIRGRLEELRRHGLKETPTRTIVIDPVLIALGWDIRDPDEVELEFPTIDGRSVDYALKLNRKPVLLVEAKPMDDALDDVKAAAQIVRYAAADGIVWCILTNGVRWKIYRSIEECSAPEKLMFEVSFDPKDEDGASVGQLAERMWRFSREEIARGTLDALGEQTFTDSKIRKTLDALLHDPPRPFLNMLRRATGDDKLNPRRIRESLIRIARAAMPETVPGNSSARTPRSAHSIRTAVTTREVSETASKRGRRSRKLQSNYDESHHTSGKPQEVIALYRAVERECLAVSPSRVQKRYLAKSISYECDRRAFCSLHLRHSGLRVWLYLKFHRLDSPPSFARDVSNVGHWGGGDLELEISKMDQIQEAMPLVRASYESRCGRSS